MKTFILIIFALTLSISAHSNNLGKIRGALESFSKSIIEEQVHADQRFAKEAKWCTKYIGIAGKVLAQRTSAVKKIKAHIQWVNNEIKETTNNLVSRQGRIKENIRTLERFKKERCDNNLNYIKSLREHKESIHILTLLKHELLVFFNNWLKDPTHKKTNAPAFIEKLAKYAHLFDDKHRTMFVQLAESIRNFNIHRDAEVSHNKVSQYEKTRARTNEEIGRKHEDNNRGELKRLEAPSVVKARNYVLELRTKVIGLIDSLINQLKQARRKLSEHELEANEHFADFQAKILKENIYLEEKIAEAKKTLLRLNVELTKANGILKRRERLREDASDFLRSLNHKCEEKAAYHKKETSRRNREKSLVSQAIRVFVKILNRIKVTRHRNADNVVGYKSTVDSSIKKIEKEAFF